MDRSQSNFGDELESMKNEVDMDVRKILNLAKADSKPTEHHASKPKPSNQATSPLRRPDRVNIPIAFNSVEAKEPRKNEVRINITTRLSQVVNEQLTEAALRQKLKKLKPDSRQDILEVALKDWLSRNMS